MINRYVILMNQGKGHGLAGEICPRVGSGFRSVRRIRPESQVGDEVNRRKNREELLTQARQRPTTVPGIDLTGGNLVE